MTDSDPWTSAKRLYEDDKLTLREVGDVMGLSHETVRTLLRQAGVTLRAPAGGGDTRSVEALKACPPRLAREAQLAAYVERRGRGQSEASVGMAMGLSTRQAETFESRYRTSVCDGGEGLPKFARHEGHVAAVKAKSLKGGGYPWLLERPLGRGCYAVCPPMIWPEAWS